MSLATPGAETRYSTQMAGALPDDVEPLYFSYRTAFTSRYDVLHLHWPETLLRASTTPRTAVRTVLALLLMARVRLTRAAIVRTLHNETPHEAGSAVERRLLALIDRSTDVFVVLNRHSRTPEGKTRVLVPHGAYHGYDKADQNAIGEPGRLLYFGLIRPYKRVPELISVFRRLTDREVRLDIVGQPHDVEARIEIEAAAAADDRITTGLRFASDEELAAAIRRCELVILPYAIHNSGALILALSLERPVLTLRTPSVEDLAAEVGPGWLFYFDDPLDDEKLHLALAEVRSTSSLRERPAFAGRDWSSVGAGYRRAYLAALGANDGDFLAPS